MRRVLAERGRALVTAIVLAAIALALGAGRRWEG
jgi:hypothetical protein